MSEARRRGLLRSPWLRGAVFVLMLAAWGWYLRGQLDELRQYPWQVAPLPFALAIGLGAAYFAGLALAWTLLLRTTGGPARAVGLGAGARIWLTTMPTRYIPGNIWHIVGRLALAGDLGVSRTQVLASATVEQGLTLLGALAVCAASLPFWAGRAGPQLWLLAALPVGLACLHPSVMGAGLGWAARRLRRPELAWPYRYREMLAALLAFAGANLLMGLALVALVAGLGGEAGPARAPFLIGAASLAWVVGFLSFLTPSGLGVREAALSAILAQVLPLPLAILAGLLHRLVLTLGELLAAAAALLILRRSG